MSEQSAAGGVASTISAAAASRAITGRGTSRTIMSSSNLSFTTTTNTTSQFTPRQPKQPLDGKVTSSMESFHKVAERLAPSNNKSKSSSSQERGFTLNQLKFPSKLYGRGKQIDLLTQTLERTALHQEGSSSSSNHVTEVAMVSGYSGTGKSTLALELVEPCRKYGGCFCSGKYDLQDRGLPYAGISAAFKILVEEILQTQKNIINSTTPGSSRRSKLADATGADTNSSQGAAGGGGGGGGDDDDTTDHRLNNVRPQLAALLGQDGLQVLKAVIPNLDQLLLENDNITSTEPTSAGEALIQSEDATRVGSAEEKQKLMFLLRKVVGVVCKAFCPVVLLLDDLQWIDSASLDLIYVLATDRDITGFMFVGCYRNNEVGSGHKLTSFLDRLRGPSADGRAEQVHLTCVSVGNLDPETLKMMVQDVLQMNDAAKAETLADVLFKKTFGNIFFVIQFLKTLQHMELLTFNAGQFEWQWDNEEISRKMISTDNVAELMTLEIENHLSRPAQNALQIVACLGNEFNESTLILLITKMNDEKEEADDDEKDDTFLWQGLSTDGNQVKRLLAECVERGFLYRQCSSSSSAAAASEEVVSYKFVHDNIQEAAISLIGHKDLAHFYIGKVLIENLPPDVQEENLFVIVDIMNQGAKVQSLDQSRTLLVELNLRAGKKALKSSAFEAASEYLAFSVGMLGHDCWSDQNYKLSLDLFSTAAHAEFCNANLVDCKAYIDRVLAQKKGSIHDKLRVYMCLVDVYNFQEKHIESLTTNLMVLKKLGVSFGPSQLLPFSTVSSFLKTKRLLSKMNADDLLRLPPMTDTTKIMAMKLMDRTLNAGYMLNSPFFPVVEFKMVRWSIKYGLCPQSAVAFTVYGLLLAGSMGELRQARVMGEVADELSQRPGWRETRSRTLMQTNNYIFPWTCHVRTCLGPLLSGYEVGMKEGDLENAFFSAYLYMKLAVCSGRPLNLVLSDTVDFTAQMKIYSQETIYQMSLPLWQFVLKMMDESAPEGRPILSGNIMVYDEMMKHLLETNHAYLQDVTRMNQLMLAFYFDDYELAWEMVEASKDFDKTNISHVTVWMRVFFMGMTAFSLAKSTKQQRGVWEKRAKQAIVRLRKWLDSGNVNCTHLLELLLAEEAALRRGKQTKESVLPLFQKAISTASSAGCIQDAGLAAERAADYLSFDLSSCDADSASRDTICEYVQLAIASYTEWGASAKVHQLKRKWSTWLPSTESDN